MRPGSIAKARENPRFGGRAGLESSLIYVLPGMVGTADKGARFDVPKAHRHRCALKLGELGWGHIALDRQMVARGAQVLTQRQDIASHRAQVAQDAFDLRLFFAQAEHHSGLGQERAAASLAESLVESLVESVAETFGVSQHVKRALIISAGPGLTIEARDGLDIVIEDCDRRSNHGFNR